MSDMWGFQQGLDMSGGVGFNVGGASGLNGGDGQSTMYGGLLGRGKAGAHVVTGELILLYLLAAFYVGAITFRFRSSRGG